MPVCERCAGMATKMMMLVKEKISETVPEPRRSPKTMNSQKAAT